MVKKTTNNYFKKMEKASVAQYAEAVRLAYENDVFRAVKLLQESLNTYERSKEIFYSYICKRDYEKRNFSYEEVFEVVNKHQKYIDLEFAINNAYKELMKA